MFVSSTPLNLSLIDPSDLPFIEVALAVKAPIIIGNRKHFVTIKKISIFTPREFLESLNLK